MVDESLPLTQSTQNPNSGNLQVLTLDVADDPQFIELVDRLTVSLARRVPEGGFWVVRIRGWFGFKWLGFSGKILGALALWSNDTTLPPFVPNRILNEKFFIQSGNGDFVEGQPAKSLHPTQKCCSSENFRNRMRHLVGSSLFIWYSSNSETAGRGSVMVHIRDGVRVSQWFISLMRVNDGWRISRTKNVSPRAIGTMMDVEGQFHGSLS